MPIGQWAGKGRDLHRTAGTQRDAEGRAICVHCLETLGRDRGGVRWHRECVRDHKIRSGGRSLRIATFARDRGVCALCGLDCGEIEDLVLKWRSRIKSAPFVELDAVRIAVRDEIATRVPKRMERVVAIAVSNVGASHLWEADHIVPKAEGGDYTGLDNIRTLCRACHSEETGKLRRRLNAANRDREVRS